MLLQYQLKMKITMTLVLVTVQQLSTEIAEISARLKTLIFRLNILGQQGISPNYEDSNNATGPDGDNYQCSYQREVVLLHGGEGWVKGDKVVVSLDSAKVGGGY